MRRAVRALGAAMLCVAAHGWAADTPRPLVQPAIPAASLPAAAARLDAGTVPAALLAETLLHVTSPGRFALAAHSASGAALELVDMITGPAPRAGLPGAKDGRLDQLLDTGTYKLRVISAAGTTGPVRLQATPFHEVAPQAAIPDQGEVDARLGDLEQRSFWFTATNAPVRIEAAGRALAELRFWRDGRELVAQTPALDTIEPTPSHPLRRALFESVLPPGTYLATAYGGPALPWADGAADMPFHLRAGGSASLRAGWVAGHIGPFGSEIYEGSPQDTRFRLDMRGPATLSVDGATGTIDRKSRDPSTVVESAPLDTPHRVVVTGAQGTPYQLHAANTGQGTSVSQPGSWWVTAVATNLGGDEVPATPVLARRNRTLDPPLMQVVASAAPQIAPGHAWHRKFNLAGRASVNFHVTAGRVAATVTGPRLWRCDLRALGDQDIIPEVHDQAHQPIPGQWDVPDGWYTLELVPRAAGIAELTLGAPGETAPLAPPGPASPAIGFGVQALGYGESLILFDNEAPGATTGLDARPTPVAIDQYALRVSQEAGQRLAVPIAPSGARLIAVELGRGEIPADEAGGLVTLDAPDHARVVALMRAWPAPPPVQPPAPATARTVLRAGVPTHFDLPEGQQRSFALDLVQGGLMQVETLGRLRTRGTLATNFIPDLRSAEANGVGQNMRVATWLRAGRTRVDVTALASAGHLGLLAAPAPVLTTQTLLPGATQRQNVPAGTGLLVPIEVGDGEYRLDLLGLRIFTARLEDAQGWPLQVAAPFDSVTRTLGRGRYRLLVLPEQTDARAGVRLTRLEKPPVLTGHGPHPLPFSAPGDDGATFTWREPAGRNDPRSPDLWSFALAASARITISIGDGMEALLRGPDGHATRFSGTAAFEGKLAPGAYVVEARSQGRNDRLEYGIRLSAEELQPGAARRVSLPGSVTFALARDQVASLASFGRVPVRATLHDAAGEVVARIGAREGDWNIALSRLLPAGRYTLDLKSSAPPDTSPVPANVNDGPQAAPDSAEAEPEGGQPMTVEAQAAQDQPAQPQNDAPDTVSGDGPSTEVTLTLPAEAPPDPVPNDSRGFALTLDGGGVHRLALPALAPGSLLLARAEAGAAVAIALEQQTAEGWHSRAVSQGMAPLIVWPSDGAAGPWRLSVWAIDGGTAPLRVAVRQVAMPAASGAPRFVPIPLSELADGVAVAHVALPSRAPFVLRQGLGGVPQGILVGAWPGHEAVAAIAGPVAPQAEDLWLVGHAALPVTLAPVPAGAPFAATLAPGEVAVLPSLGSGFAWVATAQGQPAFQGGPMGVAQDSAMALAAPGLALRNPGQEALRVAVRPVALHMLPPVAADGPVQRVLAPGEALPITLPSDARALTLTMAPGLAAIAGWRDAGAVTIWTGGTATSRTLDLAAPNLLLANLGADSAPASVAWRDTPAGPLRPGAVQKRFFGAAGSFDMAVAAAPGQRLVVAGQAEATFIGGTAVLRGRSLALPGPGRVTIDHGPGLLAVWLLGPGATPWSAPPEVAVTLPGHVVLSGQAMRLVLPAGGPVLASLRSSAPVILGFGTETPNLYPAGAAISRYLPEGARSLLVVAPQDGPLAGSLDLGVQPVREAHDGLSAPVALAPGEAALFGFTLTQPRRVGFGVQAQPDRARVTLLDAAGHNRAHGNAALLDLPPGRYLLEIQAPADASLLVRPAVAGIGPHPSGPPAEIVAGYRALAGLKVKAP